MKFKKNDKVFITIGKDKGNTGKIDRVIPETNSVIVPGMNLFKRHVKRKDDKNPGGIVDIARPLSVAKIMLVCPKCKKPTRVGYVVTKKDKNRICKKCTKNID